MSLRRRRSRNRAEKPKAAVDMTSLIDLTFLLLVTFIVTLPALEQSVSILLPKAKMDQPQPNDKKANVITISQDNLIFLNERPMTHDDLRKELAAMAAEDPDVAVRVRGDERLPYGDIMKIVKIVYDCKIHRMALVTVEK